MGRDIEGLLQRLDGALADVAVVLDHLCDGVEQLLRVIARLNFAGHDGGLAFAEVARVVQVELWRRLLGDLIGAHGLGGHRCLRRRVDSVRAPFGRDLLGAGRGGRLGAGQGLLEAGLVVADGNAAIVLLPQADDGALGQTVFGGHLGPVPTERA